MSLTFITTCLRKTVLWLGSIVLCIILVLIATPLTFMLLGYRVNASSVEVAGLAAEKKDVSLCEDIINYGLFFPPSGETRAHCVKTYASLAKDPSACELLMPSSYGWSCLGGAQSTAEACNVDGDISVSWPIGQDTLGEWKTVTMQECKQKVVSDKIGRDCCYILELTNNSNIDSCKRFENDTHLMNSCIAQLALKKKDESICSAITDANKKSMCEVQARTVRKFNNI